jgi:hypothetical protein
VAGDVTVSPWILGATFLPAVRVRKLVTTPRIATGSSEGHHWILVIRLAGVGHARCDLNVPTVRRRPADAP